MSSSLFVHFYLRAVESDVLHFSHFWWSSLLATKSPREDFFWKVLPPKIFLGVSCLAARPVKAYVALPMRKIL